MKPCPHCRAELRDSVIKCTSCGRSLLGDAEPDGPGAFGIGMGTASAENGDPVRIAATTAAPARPLAPPPGVWATPSTRAAGRPPASSPDRVALRALPTPKRPSERLDPVLLLSAIAAIAVAVFAWKAAATPWVTLILTDTADPASPELVGRLTLSGTAALVGTIEQGLAAALGVLGLLWLFYGWDRGATMPIFTSPGIGIVIAIAAVGGVLLSSELWFVWEDAAIEKARAIGMSVAELREFLDRQPAPLVKIERLDGLLRFGALLGGGFLASCTAWWAYRRRN